MDSKNIIIAWPWWRIGIITAAVVVVVAAGLGGWWYYYQQSDNGQLAACLKANEDTVCYGRFLQQGVTHYSKEEYPDALRYFRLAHQAYQDNLTRGFYAWRNEANTLSELKRYNEAKAIYEKLLDLTSEDVQLVYFDLIRMYKHQNDWEGGMTVANDAYQRLKDPAFLQEKAEFLEDLERYAEEIAVYEQLLPLMPESQEFIQNKIKRLKEVHNL